VIAVSLVAVVGIAAYFFFSTYNSSGPNPGNSSISDNIPDTNLIDLGTWEKDFEGLVFDPIISNTPDISNPLGLFGSSTPTITDFFDYSPPATVFQITRNPQDLDLLLEHFPYTLC
jgi:hypothetical protein